MSNKSNNKNKEYYLRFGGTDSEESGMPLLPPFYAYLLKLSPRVGLVDIYPWLAEVIFYSDAVSLEEVRKGKQEAPVGKPVNVITFFIDDHKDNIANAMVPDGEDGNEEYKDDFARYCHSAWKKGDSLNDKKRPRVFVVDTYGEFHRPDELNERVKHGVGGEGKKDDTALYVRSALAGAGNPARMLQKFSAIGRLDEVPAPKSEGNHGKPMGLGSLNVFVFNSITYLTRTIGFREAMQLIRAILERGVWKPNPPGQDGTERLRDKDGLLFAILHEGVHSSDEIRYAETFFDGIIRFDACYAPDSPGQRRIAYAFEQFPLLRKQLDATESLEPDYEHACCYLPRGGGRLLGNGGLTKVPRECIFSRQGDAERNVDSKKGGKL